MMKFRTPISIITTLFLLSANFLTVGARTETCPIPTTDPMQEATLMRLTYYTAEEGAITSTGCHPFEYSCAGAKKWEHCVAMIWSVNPETQEADEFLGYWDIRDYGKGIKCSDGNYSIPAGYSLDLYFNTGTAGQEFMSRYGNDDCIFMVQIFEGKG